MGRKKTGEKRPRFPELDDPREDIDCDDHYTEVRFEAVESERRETNEELEEQQKDFQCLVCHEIAQKAVTTECCRQVLCGDCNAIHRARGEHSCPCCRQEGYRAIDNGALERIIKNLPVNCLRCGQRVTRGDLESHQRLHCPGNRFKCNHCGTIVQWNNMAGHLVGECKRFTFDCPGCGDTVPRHLYAKHRATCRYVQMRRLNEEQLDTREEQLESQIESRALVEKEHLRTRNALDNRLNAIEGKFAEMQGNIKKLLEATTTPPVFVPPPLSPEKMQPLGAIVDESDVDSVVLAWEECAKTRPEGQALRAGLARVWDAPQLIRRKDEASGAAHFQIKQIDALLDALNGCFAPMYECVVAGGAALFGLYDPAGKGTKLRASDLDIFVIVRPEFRQTSDLGVQRSSPLVAPEDLQYNTTLERFRSQVRRFYPRAIDFVESPRVSLEALFDAFDNPCCQVAYSRSCGGFVCSMRHLILRRNNISIVHDTGSHRCERHRKYTLRARELLEVEPKETIYVGIGDKEEMLRIIGGMHDAARCVTEEDCDTAQRRSRSCLGRAGVFIGDNEEEEYPRAHLRWVPPSARDPSPLIWLHKDLCVPLPVERRGGKESRQ